MAMCGRFVLVRIPVEGGYAFERLWVGPDDFAEKEWFKKRMGELRARYDIRPTQEILIIKQEAHSKKITLPPAVWGVNDQVYDKASASMKPVNAINAREEKLRSWSVWRRALKHHRCIIPATAFYEWQDRQGSTKRLPWEIRRKGGDTFYFAGLCKPAELPDKPPGLFEAAIITQPGNDLLNWIHNHGGNKGRQPVFLDEEKIENWLDPQLTDADEAAALLRRIENGEWEARPLAAIGDDKNHKEPIALPGSRYTDTPVEVSYPELPEGTRRSAGKGRASRRTRKPVQPDAPGLFD